MKIGKPESFSLNFHNMADVHDKKTRSDQLPNRKYFGCHSGLDPESFSPYLHTMADVHNKATRSYNMSRIRSSNTKPEMLVRKFLHVNGFRYTLHDKKLPGKPDIVLPKYKTIIFIHGCFWHGHNNCKYYVVPQTRTDWWLNKINTNKANDTKAIKALKKEGWKIITVWECNLKPAKVERTLDKILLSIAV